MNAQKQENDVSEREQSKEQAADAPVPYPVENARHNYAADDRGLSGFRVAAAMADKPTPRASLREKLEKFREQAAGTQKQADVKEKRKEMDISISQKIYCKSGGNIIKYS